MKLWQKDFTINKAIENFTVGKDRELDLYLAKFDVQGSLAHIQMLESIGLLEITELRILQSELKNIYQNIHNGDFEIEEGMEDVHSQIEFLLTTQLGDVGKKIHSGRSRNDQVLVDLRLFFRAEIQEINQLVNALFEKLQNASNQYQGVLMPGYTHTQIAMVSSFGLWFGAFAESLTDDLQMLLAAHKINNQNPLGSAAGYGSSFPLNRTMTTELLGFDNLNYNVVHAQMGRGKTELMLSFAMASIANTLGKLATDVCTFSNQNFNFIKLPKEFTTGSSIMPHKKNPDVFELIRAKCNHIQTLPQQIMSITNNLISGYHRDFQLLKEAIFPAIENLKDCLSIATLALENIQVRTDILEDKKYQYLYSVEEVNKLVLQGVPFRDAYKKIGIQIENDNFSFDKNINHTHEGSIGNLCNNKIQEKMSEISKEFNFEKINTCIADLLI